MVERRVIQERSANQFNIEHSELMLHFERALIPENIHVGPCMWFPLLGGLQIANISFTTTQMNFFMAPTMEGIRHRMNCHQQAWCYLM